MLAMPRPLENPRGIMVFCTHMEITILIAFLAGLVSFLSPCVLPLVPGYLAFLGSSTSSKTPSRYSTFVASVFFVLGFAGFAFTFGN